MDPTVTPESFEAHPLRVEKGGMFPIKEHLIWYDNTLELSAFLLLHTGICKRIRVDQIEYIKENGRWVQQ